MRFMGYLLLLALIGYGLWPYYSLYRLDGAINQPDTRQLDLLQAPTDGGEPPRSGDTA